jgi:dihydroxyacetone kinase-like protein
MGHAADAMHQQREFLTRLDAAIGDADHGANMDRGFNAVRQMLPELCDGESAGSVLLASSSTLTATVGGASGALWGTALRCAGEALGDRREFDVADLCTALEAALDGIVELGAAQVGDKTMVDTLDPAVAMLRAGVEAGANPEDALLGALRAGADGMRATIPLRAAKGRASYLGERSIGHQDPGATSTMLIVEALAQAVPRMH